MEARIWREEVGSGYGFGFGAGGDCILYGMERLLLGGIAEVEEEKGEGDEEE